MSGGQTGPGESEKTPAQERYGNKQKSVKQFIACNLHIPSLLHIETGIENGMHTEIKMMPLRVSGTRPTAWPPFQFSASGIWEKE
jgi:hypothetical protein